MQGQPKACSWRDCRGSQEKDMMIGIGLGVTFPGVNPQALPPPGYSVQQDGEVWVVYEGETPLAGSYDSYAAAVQGAWLAFQG
jgi:hypothetical protein